MKRRQNSDFSLARDTALLLKRKLRDIPNYRLEDEKLDMEYVREGRHVPRLLDELPENTLVLAVLNADLVLSQKCEKARPNVARNPTHYRFARGRSVVKSRYQGYIIRHPASAEIKYVLWVRRDARLNDEEDADDGALVEDDNQFIGHFTLAQADEAGEDVQPPVVPRSDSEASMNASVSADEEVLSAVGVLTEDQVQDEDEPVLPVPLSDSEDSMDTVKFEELLFNGDPLL
jgi:hypothetical protein